MAGANKVKHDINIGPTKLNKFRHEDNSTLSMLVMIKHVIDSNHSIPFQKAGDQGEPAGRIYVNPEQFWKPWTNDVPVIVHCLRINTGSFGNFIANYFDAISCALLTGSHFLAVKKDVKGHRELHDVFFDAFPEIIKNPYAVEYNKSISNVKQKCRCERFCWHADDPWSKQIPLIRNIITRGLHLHLAKKSRHAQMPELRPLEIDPTRDISSVPIDTFLPFVPDFAIHYRCSDNLFGGMGYLSFGSIIEKIPSEAKYIYIFTEGDRVQSSFMSKSVPIIIKALFDDLVSYFPNSTVVVKKGGNEITVWAQFYLANITYCSASTYCFYPAIARTQTTYMSATDYIGAKEGSASGHVFIHPNYHWIKYPRLYNNFTKDTPVQDILNTLRMDLPIKL
eukprot:gene9316-19342_t